MRTIITLAHVMGLDVIAEGIENQTQGNLLEELGCEFGQGYYYSQPHPALVAGELLQPGRVAFDGPAAR